MRSIEVCAGAGGQALGLEQAGFNHDILVEIDKDACATLRINRPNWNVLEGDIINFCANEYLNIDLLAAGVPCPPFSVAGKQLGHNDERNLFPEVIRLISECMPKAVMIENVKGLLETKFDWYREYITKTITDLGYKCFWNPLNACDYGVPQLRPRTIMVAMRKEYYEFFRWPSPNKMPPLTVGEVLFDEMSTHGWENVEEWAKRANKIAPTLVGGSKKHGGADLGPTRSKEAWSKLGVNGMGLTEDAPAKDFIGIPKLTVKMAALIQGFPKDWMFTGKKTPAYRQVGNAFPPPVAKAVGEQIIKAIKSYETKEKSGFIYVTKGIRVAR